jgi:hypothetical protein
MRSGPTDVQITHGVSRIRSWRRPRVASTTTYRGTTADRDAFQPNLYHTWKQMSRQSLVIRRDPGAQQ